MKFLTPCHVHMYRVNSKVRLENIKSLCVPHVRTHIIIYTTATTMLMQQCKWQCTPYPHNHWYKHRVLKMMKWNKYGMRTIAHSRITGKLEKMVGIQAKAPDFGSKVGEVSRTLARCTYERTRGSSKIWNQGCHVVNSHKQKRPDQPFKKAKQHRKKPNKW